MPHESDADRAFTAYAESEDYRKIRDGRLRRCFPNPEDRKDCGQEIHIKVHRNLFFEADRRPPYAFDTDGWPAAPYVQSLVNRACIDYLRALGRRPLLADAEMSSDLVDSAPSSDPAVAADFDRLIRELASGDEDVERDLRLIQLREEAGYSYWDMARMFYPDEVASVPPEQLADRMRHRVRVARMRLRRELDPSTA